MSYWLTRGGAVDREFIVLKHQLRGVNYTINGVRFRDSYAVVEKNSKIYRTLKKMPILRNSQEYELTHLKNLKFVTRNSDVKMVYGQEVFVAFTRALVKKEEEQKQIELEEAQKELEVEHLLIKCSKPLDSGALCSNDKFDLSPSGYCKNHLLDDPKLEELGVEIPHATFGRENRKKARNKIIKQLYKLQEQPKEEIVEEPVEVSTEEVVEEFTEQFTETVE